MSCRFVCVCFFFRREEVSAEAQKVLRVFPNKNSEKEAPKRMPSFPDMVAYVQEKVRLCAFVFQSLEIFINILVTPCFAKMEE